MQAAAIILALAALGGVTLAVIRLRGAPWPPMWMALGHGAVAAIGVAILIYAAATTGIPRTAQIALGIFVLAFHRAGKPLPIPFVIGHGLIAVTGYVLLLLSLFGIA
jgi:hypothetical protein